VALIGPVDRNADPAFALSGQSRRWGSTAVHLVDEPAGMLGEQVIHARVADVPDPVDLAVVAVDHARLLDVVQQCGERGLSNVIISSSGFAGLGDEGAARELELVECARRYGMRVMGPNANANAFDAMPPPINPGTGKIGLVTHSGHLGRLIAQAGPHGVAFSRWIPTGNEADLEASDFIEYLAYDADTAVIAGYFEGFRDGAKLRRALAAAAQQGKPVVLLKVGRQEAAARMAQSHTAHLVGSDAAIDGLFKQYGVIRVEDIDELIESAALHAKLRPPPGVGVGLYGISGGAVALMAELAQAHGVTLPVLSTETQDALHQVVAPYLGVSNPVDNGNLYRTGTAEMRARVFDLIGADSGVSVLVCALTGVIRGITDDFTNDILDFAARSDKPVIVIWNSWDLGAPAYQRIVASGLPVFRSFRGCFQALTAFFRYHQRLEAVRARPAFNGPGAGHPPATTGRILDPEESATLQRQYHLPIADQGTARSADDAAAIARRVGFPVVLKVALEDFPHKSDAGLVQLGLDSEAAVAAAFEDLRGRAGTVAPDVREPPVLVQRQVAGGVEVIVGVTRDPALGPVILVGLGGILTEVLQDVSVRPLPITEFDAAEMVRELRGFAILEGVRGSPPSDIASLYAVILAVGALAGEPANGVVELDLNPVMVGASGATVVDSLISTDTVIP
jgi:acyl-CoA synthetase (NDP forming)